MKNNLLQTCLAALFIHFLPLVYGQGLILSEILMDPVCFGDECEFVELKNQSASTIDISDWEVSDDESPPNQWNYIFPGGTTLEPWEFVIVTKDIAAFNAEYPGATCDVFQTINAGSNVGLGNSGDVVNLINPSDVIVQSFSWSNNNVDRAEYNGTSWTTSTGGDDGDPCESAVLPIVLIDFKAVGTKTIQLTWRTATEIANHFFAIERSADGYEFVEIGRLPGAGTSQEIQEYTFTDEQPFPGTNYYRLRQVDFDGQFSYSKVVSATVGQAGGIRLFPSPATDFLKIQLEKPLTENAGFEIFDLAGRLVQVGEFSTENADFELDVAELPEGIYFLHLVIERELLVQKFLKK
jgi:hypothetical protein